MEFTIEGDNYRSEAIDAFKQFHILRRLGTVYPSVVAAIRIKDSDPIVAIGYISSALAQLSEQDSTFILNSCLAVVKIQQGTSWSNLVAADGSAMFEAKLTLQVMLEIVWRVLEENFGPFMRALLSKASAAIAQAKAS